MAVMGGMTRADSGLVSSKGGNLKEKREEGTVYEDPFVQTTKMTAGGMKEVGSFVISRWGHCGSES